MREKWFCGSQLLPKNSENKPSNYLNIFQKYLTESFLIVNKRFNNLTQTTEKTFLPCEMALAEYSIEEGLSKFLHTFMKPKTLPIGSAYMIQKNAEKVTTFLVWLILFYIVRRALLSLIELG